MLATKDKVKDRAMTVTLLTNAGCDQEYAKQLAEKYDSYIVESTLDWIREMLASFRKEAGDIFARKHLLLLAAYAKSEVLHWPSRVRELDVKIGEMGAELPYYRSSRDLLAKLTAAVEIIGVFGIEPAKQK